MLVYLPARILLCLLCAIAPATWSQQTNGAKMPDGILALDPRAWAEDAAANEVKIMDDGGISPQRFRERKIDAKGDTTREVIETKEGTVARLVQRNGQPLTADEDKAERDRLQQDIDSPADFLKHHEKDKQARQDAMQLVRQMPAAMIFTYAPGQPQLPDALSAQVVLDFRPNPTFHPPTMRAELLTGIEGRLWIDAKSKRMTRVEGHVLHPVDLGFGFVARLFPGGSVILDQASVGGDRWVYSHLVEHMTFRILMIKTIPQNSEMTTWDYRPMPSLLPFADAIRVLLAMQIPLR
jgi:hypothetical protein